MENTRRAEELNCELVVVTKPDGSLGRSQSGEVEFLRASGYKYQERSVREFAEDVLTVFLDEDLAEEKSALVRLPSKSRILSRSDLMDGMPIQTQGFCLRSCTVHDSPNR
jgi:hypothetical protein